LKIGFTQDKLLEEPNEIDKTENNIEASNERIANFYPDIVKS